MSHELDYLTWFFGCLTPKFVINKKISDLNISSDDFLLFYAINKQNIYFNISFNYFSRIETRQLLIRGKNINIKTDLIKNRIDIINQNQRKTILFNKFNILDTYYKMHKAIISNKLNNICNYNQGIEVMKLIEKIRLSK